MIGLDQGQEDIAMKRCCTWMLILAVLLAGCGPHQTPEALAAEVYEAISENETFTVEVEEPDGAVTTLDVTPETARNAAGREEHFAVSYEWSAADRADWEAQMGEARGRLLTLRSPDGKSTLQCCSGGDIVFLSQNGAETYVRAVNPREGEPLEGKLYDALELIARDAVSAGVWNAAADGSGTDLERAAAELAEQVAENYRNVPDWVAWKPLDVQAGGGRVYDVYRGEPEQFCFDMDLLVLLEEPAAPGSVYWNGGAGIRDREPDGYWHWDHEVRVVRDQNGDWRCVDWGTGGCRVELPFARGEDALLEELVEAFYLTEGLAHDSVLPGYILQRPADSLRVLPQLLEKRTDREARQLCRALAAALEDGLHEGGWTLESLRSVMGRYAAYLE